jgi:nucleoside-diphosphate-sugar epimerase
MTRSTYLVTGGAGFIGSATVAALTARGDAVRVLDDLSTGRADRLGPEVELIVGSIEDPGTVRAACAGVDRVIHLAARVSVPASWAEPVAFQRTNVEGFLNVLAAAAAAGAGRVVYASSCAVYGSLPGLPKREDAPLAPESPYAASKAADESLASAFSRGLGLPTVGLRYFNVFGPGQDPAGPYGAVIPRFVEAALAGRPLEIYGDGLQGRDFVSVRDVAAANVAAADAPLSGAAVLNIGGGRMLTILELAAAVGAAVGREVSVIHHPPRAGDVRLSMADCAAAGETIGWSAGPDFQAELARTLTWFRDNQGGTG